MSAITAEIRDRRRSDLAAARIALRSGDREQSWVLVEDAHRVPATQPMPIRDDLADLLRVAIR